MPLLNISIIPLHYHLIPQVMEHRELKISNQRTAILPVDTCNYQNCVFVVIVVFELENKVFQNFQLVIIAWFLH